MTTLQQILEALENARIEYDFHGNPLDVCDVNMLMAIKSLRQVIESKQQENIELDSIERYQMQMAAISAAAMGYWKINDEIHPDYKTPVLQDVAELYSKYYNLKKQPLTEARIAEIADQFSNKFGLENKHVADFVRTIERAHDITGETK